jgi:hypothetical protein
MAAVPATARQDRHAAAGLAAIRDFRVDVGMGDLAPTPYQE